MAPTQHEERPGPSRLTWAVGLGLASAGSNLCLLLLLLNAASWTNLLHVDTTTLEHLAANVLPQYEVYGRSLTMAWLVSLWIWSWYNLETNTSSLSTSGDQEMKNKKPTTATSYRPKCWRGLLPLTVAVALTLALPSFLEPYRSRHPIVRRSVARYPATTDAPLSGSNANPQNTHPEQPVAVEDKEDQVTFFVENMTCGGCGSYVRNLVESVPGISEAVVEWQLARVTARGPRLLLNYSKETKDYTDWQRSVAKLLEKEGYPVHFE